MDFKKTIQWSGRLYNFLEKFNLEDNFDIDYLIDNNFPQILAKLQTYSRFEKIAICQTNGKKTTTSLLNEILNANNKTFITNISKNARKYPILTSIVLDLARGLNIFNLDCQKDYYSMAMDEFELAQYFNSMKFDYLLLGNLFIDQKDYATLEEKKEKIQEAIILNSKLNLIVNADEPMFFNIDEIKNDTILNKKRDKIYFGFNKIEFYENNSNFAQRNDVLKCPNCSCDLDYKKRFYSHLGQYSCECGFKRPKLDVSADAKIFEDYTFLTVYHKDNKMVFKLPLGGVYNAYNALSAITTALCLGIERKVITKAFENYTQIKARDEIISYKNKNIKIKVMKNPVSLSENIRELYGNKKTKVVFCLNDDIKDGQDISWIWDSNLETLNGFENKIYVCSNRFDDMALRLKYAGINPCLIVMDGSIKNAIKCCYWELEEHENMMILTTPSLIDEVYDALKK